jgi:hypothetical protein
LVGNLAEHWAGHWGQQLVVCLVARKAQPSVVWWAGMSAGWSVAWTDAPSVAYWAATMAAPWAGQTGQNLVA